MSIRVTCTQGHKFTVGPEFVSRTRSCPKCSADISWEFRLRCSKGHSLKVPGKYAGQRGKCPECGEMVRVPEISDAESAETLVTNLLQDIDEPVSAGSDVLIGGTEASGVPGWQSALAELGGLKDAKPAASGSPTADQKDPPIRARTLSDAAADDGDGWKTRRCPHCRNFIDATKKSCTACGKYLGEASAQDIARSQRCGSCGSMSFPGATACTVCGVPFG